MIEEDISDLENRVAELESIVNSASQVLHKVNRELVCNAISRSIPYRSLAWSRARVRVESNATSENHYYVRRPIFSTEKEWKDCKADIMSHLSEFIAFGLEFTIED